MSFIVWCCLAKCFGQRLIKILVSIVSIVFDTIFSLKWDSMDPLEVEFTVISDCKENWLRDLSRYEWQCWGAVMVTSVRGYVDWTD